MVDWGMERNKDIEWILQDDESGRSRRGIWVVGLLTLAALAVTVVVANRHHAAPAQSRPAAAPAMDAPPVAPVRAASPPITVRSPGVVDIPAMGNRTLPTLHIFGDSTIVTSTDAILKRLGSQYRVGIDATNGGGLSDFVDRIFTDAQQSPDAVVIGLGTNDAACGRDLCDRDDGFEVRPGFDSTRAEYLLEYFAKVYPASTCVVFVNVSTHNASWGPENAETIDEHLATFPRVVDWDRAWQADWFDQADDPHPNAAGRQALAELIATQLSTCRNL